MQPIKIVPCESTGEPWVLWPRNAAKHGLSKAIYVVEESATWGGGHVAGTHDGLRDGYASPVCKGRTRAYWLAHDWVDAGRALPASDIETRRDPGDRLLLTIFGTLTDAVAKQREEFAAAAAAEKARVQAEREREAEHLRIREESKRADAEQRQRRLAENRALRAARLMVDEARAILLRDGLDLPAMPAPEYERAAQRIHTEGCTDPERAADILAEEFGLLEE